MAKTRTAFDALSPGHKAFVTAYVTGPDRFNAARAYLHAGYRTRHPKTSAYRLRQRADVQAAIRTAIDTQDARLAALSDDELQHLERTLSAAAPSARPRQARHLKCIALNGSQK